MDFRKAVFNLGNKLLDRSFQSKQVREVVCNIRTSNDKNACEDDFLYFATSQGIQFLGYLIIDESIDKINNETVYRLKRLNEKQRSTIERAHQTIVFFLDSCLKEVKDKYPHAYDLMDPYFLYQKPSLGNNTQSFLDYNDLEDCVSAFKNGQLYKKVVNSVNEMKALDDLNVETIKSIAYYEEQRFREDMIFTGVETDAILKKVSSGDNIKSPETIEMLHIFCYALKRSLETAAQLLYDAILGVDMLNMDNNNIIKIVEHGCDANFEKFCVLLQDIVMGVGGDRLGSMALLSCQPKDKTYIKVFGTIEATTVSFDEFGSTTKVTMYTVDEELNVLHRLTNTLLKLIYYK